MEGFARGEIAAGIVANSAADIQHRHGIGNPVIEIFTSWKWLLVTDLSSLESASPANLD